MPILNAGSNVTLTLTANDTVYVSTRGEVIVDAVSGLGISAGRVACIGYDAYFGPYSAGQIKLTANVTPAYYEVIDGYDYATLSNGDRLKTINGNSLIGTGNLTIAGSSGGVSVLAQSGVASSVTGTVNETTLATITIPGGTLTAGNLIRVTVDWEIANTANAKTVRVKFGGTTYFQGSGGNTSGGLTQTPISIRSSTAQGGATVTSAAGVGLASGAVTGSADITQDQQITLTATLTTASESVTVRGYTVEILKL